MTPARYLVLAAGFYNLAGAISFLVPGMLPLVGVTPPPALLWTWLPALLGTFAGIVLLISASDLAKFAVFPYWNGIIRVVFALSVLVLDFGGSAGAFFTWLAFGDLALGLTCVLGIPAALGKSHRRLLVNA